MRKRYTLKQRFFLKIRKSRSGCWEWKAARTTSGYGRFKVGNKTLRAHRVAWTLTNGEIPNGLFVLHKCDTPHCVNPDHLFLGSHEDNMKDMSAKGRAKSGTTGIKHTEAAKLKMSLAKMGITYFSVHSEEAENRISKLG